MDSNMDKPSPDKASYAREQEAHKPKIVTKNPSEKPAHDPVREMWGSIDRIHKRIVELEKRQDKVEAEAFSNSPAGQNISRTFHGS